ERLVQSRRETPPADLFESLIEPVDTPDVALDRAEHGRPVGEEVMVAEEEQGLPRILERRLDGVDRIGSLVPEPPPGREDLGPSPRPAAARQVGQRVSRNRRDDPGELAALDPGRVEQFDVADAVGEDDPVAVPIEAVLDEGLLRTTALGA